jgi:hypothetical protein
VEAVTFRRDNNAELLRRLNLLDDGIAVHRQCIGMVASFRLSHNVVLDRTSRCGRMAGFFPYLSLRYFPEDLDPNSFKRRLEEAYEQYQDQMLYITDGRRDIAFSARSYPMLVDLACLRFTMGIAESNWQFVPMLRLREFDSMD